MGKSKKISDLEMPRRASKRIAGIPLDPSPELETPIRARKCAVKKSCDLSKKAGEVSSFDKLGTDLEAKPATGTLKGTKTLLVSKKTKPPTSRVSDPSEDISNEETVKESHEKRSTFPTPPCTEPTAEGSENMKNNTSNDERTRLPLDLPPGDLFEDPCIAFAIKTLTGAPVDDLDGMKKFSGSTPSGSSNNTIEGSAALEQHAKREGTITGEGEKQRNIIPKEHMTDAETDKSDGKSGSFTDLPFTEVFADPCIEFAVKTLTGALPLDYSLTVQEYLPQQVFSFQQQQNPGIALQSITEYGQNAHQQFGTMRRPSFDPAAMIQPAFSHGRNPGVRFSGGLSGGYVRYSGGASGGYGHMGDRTN